VRYILLYVLLIAVIASRPACESATPGITPPEVTVQVEAGECAKVEDPRGLEWSDLAGISITETISTLWLRVERRPTGNTVFVCASDDVPLLINRRLRLRYTTTSARFTSSELFINARSVVQAVATASPAVLIPGEISQLLVTATGGIPPYRYIWTGGEVSDPNHFSPTVRDPGRYFVMVTDSRFDEGEIEGHFARTRVDIATDPSIITVIADPDTIDPGGSSALSVQPAARTVGWSPTTGLDDTFSSNPTTTLSNSLTYTAIASYQSGTISSTVRVTVRMQIDVSVSPPAIQRGGSAQLNAAVITGGHASPAHTYLWTPSEGLDDPTIANPIASPDFTTTYIVTVIDAFGQAVTGSARVVVSLQ